MRTQEQIESTKAEFVSNLQRIAHLRQAEASLLRKARVFVVRAAELDKAIATLQQKRSSLREAHNLLCKDVEMLQREVRELSSKRFDLEPTFMASAVEALALAQKA